MRHVPPDLGLTGLSDSRPSLRSMALSDADRQLLEFEQLRFRFEGSKDDAVREQFGISRTRYEQRLRAVVDKPEAEAEYPVLVHRLRRLRTQRRSTITRRL